MPSPLDHLPHGAGLLAAEQPVYDVEAGRLRIAAKLAARRARRELPAQSATHFCRCPDVPRDEPAAERPEPVRDRNGLTFHDHAERDLRTLATMVINETEASGWLEALITRRGIDPRGELVFACLLHLTDNPQEAQFWWQLAAGADDPTAAYCLYLHHARLGELQDAEHWLHQAARLENSPIPAPSRAQKPTAPPVPAYALDPAWVGQYLPGDTTRLQRPDQALREALADRTTVPDDDYGLISLPTGAIAAHLHDLIR